MAAPNLPIQKNSFNKYMFPLKENWMSGYMTVPHLSNNLICHVPDYFHYIIFLIIYFKLPEIFQLKPRKFACKTWIYHMGVMYRESTLIPLKVLYNKKLHCVQITFPSKRGKKSYWNSTEKLFISIGPLPFFEFSSYS